MTFEIDHLRPDRVGPPPIPSGASPPQPAGSGDDGRTSFAGHLQRECENVGCRMQFSMHARARVDRRDISLQPEQLARIDRAVDSASEKGASKALVMLDDLALIVGVKRRTVITVVDGQSLKDNVFTSIDAAVIA